LIVFFVLHYLAILASVSSKLVTLTFTTRQSITKTQTSILKPMITLRYGNTKVFDFTDQTSGSALFKPEPQLETSHNGWAVTNGPTVTFQQKNEATNNYSYDVAFTIRKAKAGLRAQDCEFSVQSDKNSGLHVSITSQEIVDDSQAQLTLRLARQHTRLVASHDLRGDPRA
jgi:hypothetical protein